MNFVHSWLKPERRNVSKIAEFLGLVMPARRPQAPTPVPTPVSLTVLPPDPVSVPASVPAMVPASVSDSAPGSNSSLSPVPVPVSQPVAQPGIVFRIVGWVVIVAVICCLYYLVTNISRSVALRFGFGPPLVIFTDDIVEVRRPISCLVFQGEDAEVDTETETNVVRIASGQYFVNSCACGNSDEGTEEKEIDHFHLLSQSGEPFMLKFKELDKWYRQGAIRVFRRPTPSSNSPKR